jgi:hypothetical protein
MSDSLASRRKRTATERSESNADPLLIRKKAREAAKSNTGIGGGAIATQVPTLVSVSRCFFEIQHVLTNSQVTQPRPRVIYMEGIDDENHLDAVGPSSNVSSLLQN